MLESARDAWLVEVRRNYTKLLVAREGFFAHLVPDRNYDCAAMAPRRTLERGSQSYRTRPIALCSAPLGGMDPVELHTLVCLF